MALACLSLGLNACMNESQQAAAPSVDANSGAVEKVIKLADDWSIRYTESPNQSASRSIPKSSSRLTWLPNHVITVSVFTVASGVDPVEKKPLAIPPSILSDGQLLDTATRAWTSLVNPDGGKAIAFNILSNNDASADIKVYYSAGTGPSSSTLGSTQNLLTTVTYSNGTSNTYLSGANLTIFGTAGGISTWASNKASLYHVLLHELGHALYVGHDPDDVYDVMNAGFAVDAYGAPYYKDPATGVVTTTTFQRYFGTNAIETINDLYNGGVSNYSPYQPFFVTRTSNAIDWVPIFGWANAKAAVEKGKWVVLKGILGKPDYARLTNKIYTVTNTTGATDYWNTTNVADFNNYLAPRNCPDRAASIGGVSFTALPYDFTPTILSTSTFNGIFKPTGGFIIWGGYYPGNACQMGLGSYYNLYSI